MNTASTQDDVKSDTTPTRDNAKPTTQAVVKLDAPIPQADVTPIAEATPVVATGVKKTPAPTSAVPKQPVSTEKKTTAPAKVVNAKDVPAQATNNESESRRGNIFTNLFGLGASIALQDNE